MLPARCSYNPNLLFEVIVNATILFVNSFCDGKFRDLRVFCHDIMGLERTFKKLIQGITTIYNLNVCYDQPRQNHRRNSMIS